jgi:hypothetical protein
MNNIEFYLNEFAKDDLIYFFLPILCSVNGGPGYCCSF